MSIDFEEGGSDAYLECRCESHFRSDPCIEGDSVLSAECDTIWTTEGCKQSFIVDGCNPLRLIVMDRTRLYSLNGHYEYDVVHIHLWVIAKRSLDVKTNLGEKVMSSPCELGCECEVSED